MKIKNDHLISIFGVAVCLLTLLILLSTKSVLSFLSVGILAAFGFIGFWILIPVIFIFGIYLIIRKGVSRFRFDISLTGIFIIVLSVLILSSAWGSEGQIVQNTSGIDVIISMFDKSAGHESLSYNTAINYFQQITYNYAIKNNLGNELIKGFNMSNMHLGGGYVGYIFCGVLNTAITTLGTTILCWILVGIGLILIFNQQIKKLFLFIFKNKKKTSVSKEVKNEDVVEDNFIEESQDLSLTETVIENLETNFDNDEQPNRNTQELFDLSINNYNKTHSLHKPTFVIENNNIQPVARKTELYQTNPFISRTSTYNETIEAEPEIEEVSEPIVNESFNNEQVTQEIKPSFLEEQPLQEQEQVSDTDIASEQIATNVIQQTVAPQIPDEPQIPDDPEHRPQPKATVKPAFRLPPLDLLDLHENPDDLTKNQSSCDARVEALNQIFSDLRVGAEVTGYTVGPSVTRYDVKTKENVSVNAIKRIVEDISIRLGGVPARFESIVLGRNTSGLEIENEVRTNVGLRESMELLPNDPKYSFDIPFGKDISGNLVHAAIKDFPHMLVAGATGSGKSIFVHSCLLSLVMKNTPYQLKLLLIDPKRVEMAYYRDLPHLLCPNVSEPRKALVALKKLVTEMQRRYNLFENNHVRDIKEFNIFAKEQGLEPLPYIVVCIDEYADLSDDCKEIREPVVRIAQKARSAGIHMIIATQRPSVSIIDGVIKANLNTRVALMVSSYTDSSVIVGEGGAEKLLGNGDMIVDSNLISKSSKPRVQGCFVSSSEINRVTDFLRSQSKPMFDPEFLDLTEHTQELPSQANVDIVVDTASLKEASEEQLLEAIKADLALKEYCSISFIQRTYGVGFPKAGRLFNKLVQQGVVAPTGDSRGSKVLLTAPRSEEVTSSEESTLIINGDIDNQGEN